MAQRKRYLHNPTDRKRFLDDLDYDFSSSSISEDSESEGKCFKFFLSNFFHNLANQQHQLYFFPLPSSTGNQEGEPPNVVSNDNIFCNDSDIASSSVSEELQGEVSPLHTLPAEITPPRATTPPAATVITSPPPSPPLVLQPTTPSYTGKDSSAESI